MATSFKKFVEDLSISYEYDTPTPQPGAEATTGPSTDYGKFIGMLLSARDKAHALHLATKSYAEHMALNELYELLLDQADEMAEMFQGKYGIVVVNTLGTDEWSYNDGKSFVEQLTNWLETMAKIMIGCDPFIVNKYEELVGDVYRVKYKLDNLN